MYKAPSSSPTCFWYMPLATYFKSTVANIAKKNIQKLCDLHCKNFKPIFLYCGKKPKTSVTYISIHQSLSTWRANLKITSSLISSDGPNVPCAAGALVKFFKPVKLMNKFQPSQQKNFCKITLCSGSSGQIFQSQNLIEEFHSSQSRLSKSKSKSALSSGSPGRIHQTSQKWQKNFPYMPWAAEAMPDFSIFANC